jgi:hypothetical protein
MKINLAIIIVTCLMIGCQKDNCANDYKVIETFIDKVEVNDTLRGANKRHFINIFYKVSGCNTYKYHEEIKGNNFSTFEVYVYNPNEFNKENVCLTGIFNEQKNIEFIPLTSGEYTLYFNDSSLAKKVIILK